MWTYGLLESLNETWKVCLAIHHLNKLTPARFGSCQPRALRLQFLTKSGFRSCEITLQKDKDRTLKPNPNWFSPCKRTQDVSKRSFCGTHPDDDAHPLALGREGEDLQDVKGDYLSRGSLQLQRGQVPVHEGQANALRPPHQRHLQSRHKHRSVKSPFLHPIITDKHSCSIKLKHALNKSF